MDMFKSSGPITLQPIYPPLGLHPHYCVDVPTTLVLSEGFFRSIGNATVVDTNGVPVIRCQGNPISWSHRKTITDANGRTMFYIRDKIVSVRKQYIGEDEDGIEIFRVTQRISFSVHMEASFRNASTGQIMTLEVRGDFLGGSAAIFIGDGVNMPIAQLSRDWSNVLRSTYFVTVAPGVDLALIAAICICFEEAKNDSRKH